MEHSINNSYETLQGLQNKIQLVPISLDDKPTWYKEVYPPAKVCYFAYQKSI